MQETDKLLGFLKEPNIFDLDLIDNGMIAGTRIETFYKMRLMLDELMRIENTLRLSSGDRTVSEDVLQDLYRKYPILEFTKQARSGPGNLYWQLTARVIVWRDVRLMIDSPISCKEQEADMAFVIFFHEYNVNLRFRFLKKQPNLGEVGHFLLERYALDDLWAFAQRLKLRPLTPSQEKDRQKLEQHIASKIRRTLIDLEKNRIVSCFYMSGEWISDHDFDQDTATAIRTVDKRIEKGDWQPRLGPYKFKFNGI